MLALFTALAMTAQPTLASPAFSTLNVSPEVGAFCNDHLAQQLAARGVEVTTARQINALLGLERQRQLAGCSESEGSCLAELASALGAQALLLGDLGRLGAHFQINVRVQRSSTNQTLATASRTVSNEDGLLGALESIADELAPRILESFGVLRPARARSWPLAPTLVSGALGLAGGALLGWSTADHLALTAGAPGSLRLGDATATATRGELTQWIGVGSLIGAGLSLAFAVVWYFAFSGGP